LLRGEAFAARPPRLAVGEASVHRVSDRWCAQIRAPYLRGDSTPP